MALHRLSTNFPDHIIFHLHQKHSISKLTNSFRNSSAVEQWTVNPLVVGSNPTSGDSISGT